jgi:hypothetical protein
VLQISRTSNHISYGCGVCFTVGRLVATTAADEASLSAFGCGINRSGTGLPFTVVGGRVAPLLRIGLPFATDTSTGDESVSSRSWPMSAGLVASEAGPAAVVASKGSVCGFSSATSDPPAPSIAVIATYLEKAVASPDVARTCGGCPDTVVRSR